MIGTPRPLALLLFVLAPISSAQEPMVPATLVLERTVEANLDSSGRDNYVVDVGAGHFVHGTANQISVDVVVTVFGPNDAQLAKFDGPAVGPEPFTFETRTAGRYRVEVAPFEKASGDYAITLEILEPIAKTGPGRVDQLMTGFSGDATPGGVIAVVRSGEVLFEKAYGMANLVHAVPFTTATPSNLGSTSKQFTAFAIAILDSEGKLSLDDDVRKHIPEIPDFGQTVTLRNLLTHTSGYREFLNTLAMAGRRLDKGDSIDRDELIGILKRQPKLQNSPGAEWNYNNTGYGLLTVVLERVTGETFPEWMKAHVFAPLKMTSTVVRADPSQIIPGSSQGYTSEANGFLESRDLGGAMGAGGIYSTVGDLAKWTRNLQTGELGGKAVIEAMTTPFELSTGKATGYGLGLFIDEQSSLRRIHHGGADSAHRAMLMTYPDIEAGVVALSNNASFDSTTIAAKIGKAFFAEHMQLDADPGSDVAEAAAAKDTSFDRTTVDPSDFDAFVGRYELEELPGFILTFTRKGDRFFGQASGQEQMEFVPTSPLTFTLEVVDAAVTFHKDADGKVTGLTLSQNGEHAARRLDGMPWAPTPEQLAAYQGRYFSEELETFYTVALEKEQLVARHRRLEAMKLTPADEHEFAAGSFQFAFTVTDAGDVQGFSVSSGRTRDVEFTRMR